MEYMPWIAAVSLIVSVLSMIIAGLNRRDTTSHAQITLMLAPIIKEIEATKLAAAQANAKTAEHANEMLRLEIKLLEKLAQYPTTAHLDSLLHTALEPVLLHMQKTESFIEEVLRSGTLQTKSHRS